MALSIPGSVETVSISVAGSGFTSAPTVEHTPPLTTYQFLIEAAGATQDEPSLTYTTTSPYTSGTPATIEMLSNGLNYFKLPQIKGLIRSEAKQTKGEAVLSGTSITDIQINFPGFDYINPTIIIEDITGAGSGAVATPNVDEFGSIRSVNMISTGSNYVEPVIHFVEEAGTYLAVTKDIGRIVSATVTDSGEPFHTDKIATPEIHNGVRVVVSFPGGQFVLGEEVWQGTLEKKLVTATVVSYDSFNSTLLWREL